MDQRLSRARGRARRSTPRTIGPNGTLDYDDIPHYCLRVHGSCERCRCSVGMPIVDLVLRLVRCRRHRLGRALDLPVSAHRIIAAWLVLGAAGGLAAGCGGSSGASAASATPQTSAPITRAQATAYAHAVNLRAADVPEMSTSLPEGAAPAPKRSAFELARCYGGVSPARRIIKVHSPAFLAGHAVQSQLVESRVEVWPTPGLAARNNAAYLSSRGRACFLRSLEALHKKLNKQRAGQLQFGPSRVATVANPLSGVSRSFLRTIVESRLRGGQIRLHIYHDIFTFISGAAEIELEAIGFTRPLPSATEERLLLLLLSRAKANKP